MSTEADWQASEADCALYLASSLRNQLLEKAAGGAGVCGKMLGWQDISNELFHPSIGVTSPKVVSP